MIPAVIAAYLRDRYPGCTYRVHEPAETAVDLAAAEHVPGGRVAKVVIVKLGGEVAIAVVPATDRVNLRPLEEATAERGEIATERELAERFRPCEPGATAPLALFGVPIYADDTLLREQSLLLPAGTHEDAAVVRTSEWRWSERVQPITHLGHRVRQRMWRVRAEPSAHPRPRRRRPRRDAAAAAPTRAGRSVS